LREVAARLEERSSAKGATLAIVATDTDECLAHLERALGVLADESRTEYTSAQGIYYGEQPLGRDEKVAFLFPGQGSQYVNMAGDLADCFPFVGEMLERTDAIVERVAGRSVLHTILCESDLSEEEREARAALLLRTDYNHPALLGMGMVIMRCLERAGVRPQMVAGHSVGEYSALHAAGVFDMRTAVSLITSRGSRIHERCFQRGAGARPHWRGPFAGKIVAQGSPASTSMRTPARGAMASIGASVAEVQEGLESTSGFVIVANKNCPAQTVISGDEEAVEEALARFREMGLQCRRLPVSSAFHTPLLSSCVEPFREFLGKMPIRPPRYPS